MSKERSSKNLRDNYYKAYEERYSQVYKHNYLWSSKDNSKEVLNVIQEYHIPKNSTILEIGCGEGRDAIYLLKKGYQVIALDYSKTVIEKCKELANYRYNDAFRQFDIITDELKEKFDFIYSVAVIHMFVNKEHRQKFYQFIQKHLNKDGLALIISMGDGIKQYESNIEDAFNQVERTVLNKEQC